MAEALARVKKTLGPQAVILRTRTVKHGGVLGVGARSVVEITATRDVRALPPAQRRAIIGRGPRRHRDAANTRGDTEARRTAGPSAEGAAMRRSARDQADAASRQEMTAFTSALRGEMGELRAMVRELLDRSGTPTAGPAEPPEPPMPEALEEYYTRLIQNEVAEEIAREVIAEAQERLAGLPARGGDAGGSGLPEAQASDSHPLHEIVPEVLIETIGRMLPPAGPIALDDGHGRPRYVVLVGPTGVGKTTTVAKLAAHFKLRENKRVGLITADTYRIAAVEQLRVYADILNIPLQVVLTPEEMTSAVASTSRCDLVLIDTSGRSQRDARRLDELNVFLEAARTAVAAVGGSDGDASANRYQPRGRDGRFRPRASGGRAAASFEIHLVLSCTAHRGQLVEAAERFGALGADHVVFTKLDEAVGLGVILNVIRRLDLELSYLTTGQDVPDDIEIGHGRRIAELVLGRPAQDVLGAGRPLGAAPLVEHVA